MKKMISNIKTLAALLMVGTAFTACSNDDEITAEQPVQPTEPQVYTMVIKASKGDDAMTRALKPGFNSETGKNTIDFYWSGNEKIDVGQISNSGYYVKIGTATAAPSATGETTITATFNSAPNPASYIQFFLCGGNQDYTGQVGLLTGENSISEKYDYFEATLNSGKYTVDGYNITPSVGITFNQSINSIVKFILVDKGNSNAAINATKLNIHGSLTKKVDCFSNLGGVSCSDLAITPAGTTNEIYVALASGGSDLRLTARADDNIFSYSKSNVSFWRKNYEITVKMNKILSKVTESNAASVLGGAYTAISADDAATLAKECWTIAGGNVYVVTSASGSIYEPNISYVLTNDGTNTYTGTFTTQVELMSLYSVSEKSAWFVEPASSGGETNDYWYVGVIPPTDPNNPDENTGNNKWTLLTTTPTEISVNTDMQMPPAVWYIAIPHSYNFQAYDSTGAVPDVAAYTKSQITISGIQYDLFTGAGMAISVNTVFKK